MTFGDLKTKIITSLNRDDLTDVVIDYTESTIRKFQGDFYYPTPVTGYVDVLNGQWIYPSEITSVQDRTGATVALTTPMSIVRIDHMRLNYSSVWFWLVQIPYETILRIDVNIPPTSSVPTNWAIRDDIFRLFPCPGQDYQLEITGNAKIPIPADDDTTNFWTEGAADLVIYATLAQLYAIRIHSSDDYQRCAMIADQHRLTLVKETINKASIGQFACHW